MDGDSLDFITKQLKRADGTTKNVTLTASPSLPNFVADDYPVWTNGEILLTCGYQPTLLYAPQTLTNAQLANARNNLGIAGLPGERAGERFGVGTVSSGYAAQAEGGYT
jgi:hypothetical protein